jgi:hypothetical protein
MRARIKTKVFWVIMLLATWLFIEVISLIACGIIDRSPFSYGKARAKLTASIAAQSAGTSSPNLKWEDFVEVLHPYFGFVADPYQNKPEWKVSDYGFILSENKNPVVKRSPGKVIIGLFGGSFANGVCLSLRSLLNNQSAALGKEFVVINFSAGGYKQPQQLMILNYLLALGGEFDLVVNVDGFNEVALPPAENIPHQVNPFYPRAWQRRTATLINPATIRLIGRVEVLKESQEKWAQMFKTRRLYLSPTLFLLWQYRDKMLARTIYETNQRITTEGDKSASYTMRGPAYIYKEERDLYRDIADVWKRSSLQMKVLCDANGIKYYHFLQPNQYVEGSKPITGAEKKQALNDRSPYKPGVVKGYPVLTEVGNELKAAGVNFTDLTMIFSEHPEALYSDDCCHTSRAGTDIVAKRIYETIYGR